MLILIISTLIFIASSWVYLLYKDKFEIIKSFIKLYIIIQLKKILNKLEGKNNHLENQNTISFEKNHVHITYHLNGNNHDLRIPHHTKNKLKLNQIILINNDEMVEIDITHKHGLPYYLSAKDLGGHKIVHKKGDEVIMEFHHDEIPYI